MARILVALSGGVDSAAAAALLTEQGHEVVAAYMKNWVNDENIPGECPWERDIEDALGVCPYFGVIGHEGGIGLHLFNDRVAAVDDV